MNAFAKCLMFFSAVAAPLCAQTWIYDFTTSGIDGTYWSTVNTSGTFTFTSSGSGVTVAGGTGSFQTGKLSLNLAEFPTISGDFSVSATFTGGGLNGGVHQIQLEVNSPSAGVLVSRSNQSSVGVAGGNSVNVFDGAVLGFTTLSGADAASGVSTPMTLTLARTGVTYTASWNNNQFWSGSYTADSLTSVYLALNNNYGATDPTQVTWQSFSITSTAIPEPSTYAMLAGLAGLGFAIWRRRAAD